MREHMTIGELSKRKKELEENIAKLVNDFQSDVRVNILEVNLETMYAPAYGEPKVNLLKKDVDIVLHLPDLGL